MRILHFVSGLDAASGGPSASVPNQCIATVAPGICVDLAYARSKRALAYEVISLEAQGVGVIPLSKVELLARLPRLLANYDILHVNGIWSPSCAIAATVALARNMPLVITPHGMLEPWALEHKTHKKRLALALGYRALLSRASVIQATASSEASNIENLQFGRPVAIIPNSIQVPQFDTSIVDTLDERRILFLSRIHPKKGVLQLVRAIHANRQVIASGNWVVIVAGPDDAGHWNEVEREASLLNVSQFIRYVGPVFGDDKWQLYRSATLFALPTFSENFGLVVAEALACGVPALTTFGAPWEQLNSCGCGWWHKTDQQSLNQTLATALCKDLAELRDMGNRGIELVRSNYSVTSHRSDFHQLYRWILEGGTVPECFATPTQT